MLALEAKRDALASNLHMGLAQRRHAVRARRLRVALTPHAKPREIDEADGERADTFRLQRIERHVLAHREPQLGELLGETDELVVLQLLLLRAKVGVVEVLAPSSFVDASRLQLRARVR